MRGWLKAHWIAVAVGAVLFLVGIGVGAAPSGAEEADAEAAEPRTVTVSETESETVTETETVDPTEDQVAALDERDAELDDRAAALRERERKVKERERKVGRAERVQARSTFGDGVYLVGKDIPAGSYIAPGSSAGDCYWARLEADSQEILDNHIGGGQVRVTINSGELFETSGCGTWRRG